MTIKIEDPAISITIIGIEEGYDLSVDTIIDYLSVDNFISKPEHITQEQMLVEADINGNCYLGNPKMLVAMVYIIRFLNKFKDENLDEPRFVGIADMIGSFTEGAIKYVVNFDSSLGFDKATVDDIAISFVHNDDMFKHKVLKKLGFSGGKDGEVEDLPDYYVDMMLYIVGLGNVIRRQTTTVEDPSQVMSYTYKVSGSSIGNH